VTYSVNIKNLFDQFPSEKYLLKFRTVSGGPHATWATDGFLQQQQQQQRRHRAQDKPQCPSEEKT